MVITGCNILPRPAAALPQYNPTKIPMNRLANSRCTRTVKSHVHIHALFHVRAPMYALRRHTASGSTFPPPRMPAHSFAQPTHALLQEVYRELDYLKKSNEVGAAARQAIRALDHHDMKKLVKLQQDGESYLPDQTKHLVDHMMKAVQHNQLSRSDMRHW
jgi:hypothetical protein